MAAFKEFTDPRLVAVYDGWDPLRVDHAFYRDLADAISAKSIVDVGCGTGRLAVELARMGYRVTGVDPSPAMIDVAHRRPAGGLVQWIEGDASALGSQEYDLAVMPGQVVQFITDDRDLGATFTAIHRALRPGGRLAFDSHNPAERPWTRWTPEQSALRLPDGVDAWYQDARVDGDRATYEVHYRFPGGEVLVSHNERRFRSIAWLTHALIDAGFQVDPTDHEVANVIFLATADPVRRPVVVRVNPDRSGSFHAAVLFDSAETVTVPITGLDITEVLQRMRDLGVEADLVLPELERFNLGWDVRDDVRRRSEADMADWRQSDRERREQLKREFREAQSKTPIDGEPPTPTDPDRPL